MRLGLTSSTIILIYGAAAILPGVFLLLYIYKLDTVEKEPPSLIWKLLLGGLGAAVCALILEEIFNTVSSKFVQQSNADDTSIQAVVDALFVAVIEESSKFVFLKKISWKHPAFNCRFDGMVYAISVSLGFAILENVLYVFFYGGLSVALSRALLSIPAHMCFGAYMGIYYGRAKVCQHADDASGTEWNLVAALLTAMVFHMIYDATLMVNTGFSIALFALVVLFMYVYVFWRIRREAADDEYIDE